MPQLTVAEVSALFLAARSQGVLRFKLGELEVHLEPGSSVVRARGAKRPPPPATDGLELAIDMQNNPGKYE